MFIPYRVDVPMFRQPVTNYILIGLTVVVSNLALADSGSFKSLVLDGWNVTGLLGYVVLHGGLVHLLGNMLFLWVFGNAVCAKIGNVAFLPVYLGLGLVAAVTHNLFVGGPCIGASGAINGIVGMFLIWYPVNEISCVFFIALRPITFSLSSAWMIIFWFVLDIWGATSGGNGGVAYWAHLGGFLAGAALAVILLKTDMVGMDSCEKSLLEVVGMD